MYYIGIDGSGAYSKLVGGERENKIIGRHVGGCLREERGYQQVEAALVKLLGEFCKLSNVRLEDCAGVCVGTPDVVNDGSPMKKFLEELNPGCPVTAVNDIRMTLAAEAGEQPGILILAGNHAVGWAVDEKGQLHRCGGWGRVLDDGGSAYWMGMEALRYALMSYDGRLAKSVLPEKIAEHFGLKSMEGVAALFHSQAIEEGAVTELAYLVKETAAGRDRMAQRIEKNAAAELYLLAQSLIRKLDFAKRPVLLGGSILLGNESVRQELTNLIRHDFPQCPVAAVRQKPETGALWLAIRGR